jgi:diguanylate cyclase (GGDEF)-like protein
MSGIPYRAPRPFLFIIVFGVFLAIVGVTAMAQIVLVSANFSTSTLNAVAGTDAALVRTFVTSSLSPADLGPAGPSATRRTALDERLETMVDVGEILRISVLRPDGLIVASSDGVAVGTKAAIGGDLARALDGAAASASIVDAAKSESEGPALGADQVIREYFPLVSDGEVRAIVGVWRDAMPVLDQLEALRRNIVLVTLTAALIAAAALYLVFRSAQRRISRQARALVDATERDTLTGRLNHGALVEAVATAIEQSKLSREPFAIALLDVDNFRLLNDNYGHNAGDDVLLTVADLLSAEAPAGAILGRYGPDELLIIIPAAEISDLEPALERLRSSLVDHELRFGASERLPLTFSAGICTFPEHGDSVTALLAVAALTLQEAKGGGGNAIRMAGASLDHPAETRTFDVLQGLILAVDTKDRYTKRHSEDVARYGIFLAGRIGMTAEQIGVVRVAGLLHDVGKIGVPDSILRKPGSLTEHEETVVRQHVALGDMIVRDLPNIDLIRAAVRHHHERWDGEGYLDHLAGEEIPLIARILAVGDAFSAMTTTRPYRKALGVREALTRLGDAAGTQLDERLVSCFIEGIETDADAPLPGADSKPLGLWTPYRQVA